MLTTQATLFPQLQTYCQSLHAEFDRITEDRKAVLHTLSGFVSGKISQNQVVNLTYICTHNSRRSQFGQAWAKVAATWYGLADDQVKTWSGGTETTAFNPRAVAALQRAGFAITDDNDPENPRYSVQFSEAHQPLTMFSKVFSDAFNPSDNYCALMVCTSADEACPVVFGADARISLPYEDPKRSDGTPQESQSYDDTCRLIARELFYTFAHATGQLPKPTAKG